MKEHEVVSPAEDRYLMTVIATASQPALQRLAGWRWTVTGPTYTVDTLRRLKDEQGADTDLFFITGADAMLEILQWKEPEELFELAHFIAATRPGLRPRGVPAGGAHPAPEITVMNIPALAISLHRHPRARAPRGGRSATSCPRA